MILHKPMSVFLADDDEDDCLFFKEAIEELSVSIKLTTANDGEQLMQLLTGLNGEIPSALFLDLNMPRKNGFECLAEIRNITKLNSLAIVIFSTSFQKDIADRLYENGAQYYVRKPALFKELKEVIEQTLSAIEKTGEHTQKDFILV